MYNESLLDEISVLLYISRTSDERKLEQAVTLIKHHATEHSRSKIKHWYEPQCIETMHNTNTSKYRIWTKYSPDEEVEDMIIVLDIFYEGYLSEQYAIVPTHKVKRG